jgi:hypothetical protein
VFLTLCLYRERKFCFVSYDDIYCVSTWLWRTNEGYTTYWLVLCANIGTNVGIVYSNVKSTTCAGYINIGTFVSATGARWTRSLEVFFFVPLKRAKSAVQWRWRGQWDHAGDCPSMLYMHDFRFCVPFVRNNYKRNRLPQPDVIQGHKNFMIFCLTGWATKLLQLLMANWISFISYRIFAYSVCRYFVFPRPSSFI